jgi:opacity protein-like surface antigen
MYRTLLCCLTLVLLSAPAGAQSFQRFEVFGGYQYSRFPDPNETSFQPTLAGNGWNASFAYNLTSLVGLKADFGGGYATDTVNVPLPVHTYTYTFGPVLTPWRSGHLIPFGEVLFGRFRQTWGGSCCSASVGSFAFMAGGGLDVKVHKHVALRLGELDYLYLHVPYGVLHKTHNLRFSGGVVFRF